ncbi:hypothetical protein KKG36_01305 [Patescibacteria group bacterium]|nr:hypothetical protein [Patescibacteria group bacterium]
MVNSEEAKTIKEIVEEFFSKMTIPARVELKSDLEGDFLKEEDRSLDISIKVDDPQVLIGEMGQTLNEIQRFLKAIVNKKLGRPIFINVDVNEYKQKKSEYLKDLAKDLADEVSLNKEAKVLSPMPSYERRIIHSALSSRTDVITESEGEGLERRVVIKPKP